ncbi:MAG: hydrogenase nickel incorporation protein HypA [Candidatus Hadarchaeales archaeon]
MHEWAIAEGIVEALLERGRREGAKRITGFRLILGEIQGVEEELLRFALGELSRGTMLEGAEVRVEREKGRVGCRSCGFEWFPERGSGEEEALHFLPDLLPLFLKCPRCGSVDLEIKGGRGIWVSSLEIER